MLWILLYGFVGTQMTWRLSPFIGKPEDPFFLIKPSRDNFYVDVVTAIQGALNLSDSGSSSVASIIFGSICIVGFGILSLAGGIMLGKANRISAQTKADQEKPAN